VHVVPGILWNLTGRAGVAPLQIITNPGADYYVKLVNSRSGSEQLGIYVRGGHPIENLVPLGEYEMRYATGRVWYGETALFGSDTAYVKAREVFRFTAEPGGYQGYTVELIAQVGGNLLTQSISAENF